MADQYLNNVVFHTHFDADPNGPAGCPFVKYTGDVIDADMTGMDPLSQYVSVLLKLDGPDNSTTITDETLRRWEVMGSAKLVAGAGRNGKSALYLPGGGAAIRTTDVYQAGGNLGSTDFTVEAWVKLTALPTADTWPANWSAHMGVVCGGIPGNASGWALLLGASLVGWNNNDAFAATGTHNITTNVWYHVAVTRQAGTLRSFVNGVKIAEVANITSYYSYNNGSTRTWVGCETGDGAWFQGYIDQVRITSGVARYTANFDVDASDVQTFMPVKPISINEKQDAMPRINPSLYPVMGMASTSSSKYRGKSIFMNRNCSTANIVDASSRPIALWASDFTFSAWVNMPDISNGGNWYWLLDEYNGTSYYNSGNWLRLGILNGTFACYYNGTQVLTSSTAIQAGVWTHIAFTRKGGVNRIFVNGALTGSGGSNPNYSAAVDRPVLFNAADTYNISAFYGYVSDFLFEIGYARWDAAFVPGRIDDLSAPVVDQKGKVIIPYGTIDGMFTSGVKRFGNSCAYFNGTNYLTVPHSNDFNFGSGDYTIEFWMMHNNNSSAKGIMHRSFNTTPLQGWQIQIRANNTIGWEHNNGTSGDLFMSGQTALKSNVWYHIAVTRESNVHRLYVNGYCEAEFTDVGAMQDFVASTGSGMWASSLCIGSDRTAGANFVGWIDEVRITKGVARYTMPTIDQTLGDPYFKAESVFLPMNTNATIDPYAEYVTFQIKPATAAGSSITESTGKTMTQSGNVVVTAANTKWGTSSLGFPGVNSDLSTPSSADFNMTSGDWTWEMWYYEDPSSQGGLLSRRSTGAVGWNLTTSGLRGVVNGTGFEGQMSWNRPSFNTWHHIAWQKKGTTLETYIDGQLVAQKLNVSAIQDEATSLRLGACNNAYESCFRGYIEDVRFTKGVARYNNNFAVPTSTYNYDDDSQGTTVLSMHMEGSQNNGDPYRDNVQVNLRGDTLTDDCGNAVIVTGSVTVDATQTRNGSATIRVSPAQDLYYNMIEVTHTKAMDLTGDFTIEMWFKALTTCQSTDMLFFRGNSSGTLYAVASYGSGPTSQMIFVGLWGGSTIISASAKSKITLNAWNHIAVCRQGSTMTLYLNGKNAGTGTYAGTLSPAVGTTWQIGGGAGYTGRSINGWIDDFRYTNGVCRYTGEFYSVDGVPVTGNEIVVDGSDAYLANTVLAVKNERLTNADPYSANVTFQMRMDGSAGSQTFIEDTGKVVIVTGNVNHNTGIIRPGSSSSAYFDGSADRISSASYADVSIGAAEDFTLETWFYTTAGGHGAAWSRMVMLGSDAVNGMLSIVCVNSDNPMRLRVEGYNGGYFSLIGEPSTTISNSTWHHVALTKKAGLYTLWVDGAIYAQGFNSAYAITATTVFVGGSSGAYDFNGYIDDVRLTKGVARYSAEFVPQEAEYETLADPIWSNTSLLMHMNGDIAADDYWSNVVLANHATKPNVTDTDIASTVCLMRMNGVNGSQVFTDENGRIFTTGGNAQLSSVDKKWGSTSAYFDGTGDYVVSAADGAFDFGTGDFTVEAWFNLTDASATNRNFLAINPALQAYNGIYIGVTSSKMLDIGWTNTTTSILIRSNTTPVSINTWNHVAMCRKGNIFMFFLNGVLVGAGSNAGACKSGCRLTVGGLDDSNGLGNAGWMGYVDDVRITKGVARYAGTFAVPTSAFPTDDSDAYWSNNVLLLNAETDPYWNYNVLQMHMDGVEGGTVFRDACGHTITINGGVITKTGTKKSGMSSAYFDGASYLSTANTSDYDLRYGNFTIEAWVNNTSTSNYHGIMGARANSAGHGWCVYVSTDGNLKIGAAHVSAGYQDKSFNIAVPVGQWAHIAIVKTDSGITGYVNGVAGSTLNNDGFDYQSSQALVVGALGSQGEFPFLGYIDEIRITKGHARYTGNFTPAVRTLDTHVENLPAAYKYSHLACACAVTANGTPSAEYDQGATGNASYADWWNEFGIAGSVSSTVVATGSPADTGVLATKTLPINADYEYYLYANNACWGGDVCSFTLEFLNASGSVVAAVFSPGTGSYNHPLYYGASTSSYSQAPVSGYNNTNGRINFTNTALTFTNDSVSNYNGSFSYACSAKTITQVRISNVRAKENYTGVCGAYVLFRKNAPLASTFNDRKLSGADATGRNYIDCMGSAKITNAQSKFGTTSFVFDGDQDYLLAPSGADFDFTVPFTMEMWVKVNSYDTAGVMFAHRIGGFEWFATSAGVLQLNSNSSTAVMASASGTFTTGAWHHLAIIWNGSSYAMYMNGAVVAAAVSATSIGGTGGVYFGSYIGSGSTNYCLNGYMDEVRITKGTSRYGNMTVPTAEHEGFSGWLKDIKGNSFTTSGLPVCTGSTGQFGQGSVYFNGASYVTYASNSAFAFGTDDFSIDFWFKLGTAGTQYIMQSDAVGTSTSDKWYIAYLNGDIVFARHAGGGTIAATQALNVGTWYHLAVTRQAGRVYLFLDGTLLFSSTSFSAVSFAQNGLTVGAISTPYYFNGYINDLRVTAGVARWNVSFTRPSAEFLEAGGFKDEKGHVSTIMGGATLSTNQKKFGTHSAYFDGTGDAVKFPASTDWNIAGNPFTIEAWVMPQGSGTNRHVIGYNNASATDFWDVSIRSGQAVFRYAGNGAYITHPYVLTNDTWYHVAAAFDGTYVRLYVNGVGVSVKTGMTTANGSYVLSIGGNMYNGGTEWFQGYIDEVRITKGVCRYNQPDFTPQQMYRIMSFEHTGRDVIPYGDAKISTSNKKYGTGSVYFDGSGDYISIPYSTDFEVGSGDFTIEFWANVDDFSTGRTVFAFQTDFHLGAFFATNGRLYVFMSSNGTDWSSFVSGDTGTLNGQTNTTVLAGTWNHYAIVRQGTSVAVFLNGQIDTIIPVGTTAVVTRAETALNLGRWGSNAYYMKGYIDDFRFTKGVARYAINTIPSVSDIPASATQFYDDCGNTIQNYGVSYVSTNPKFGSKSAYFSGGNSYLKFTSNLTNFAFGLQDYSISMWIYPETVGGTDRCLFDTRGLTSDTGLVLHIYATGSVLRVWTNNTGYTGTIPIVANTWTHVAMTRRNGKIQLFVNGVCDIVTETSINHICSSQVYIGRRMDDTNANFIGYMEDVRVTKGGVPSYIMNIQTPTSLPSVSSEGIMEMTKGDVITGVGPTISGTQKKYGNSSLKFSRAGQKITLTARNQFTNLGDVTYDFWIMPTSIPANTVIFDSRTGAVASPALVLTTTGAVSLYYNNSYVNTSTATCPIGQWTHVALVRKGFNWTWYFNGVAAGTFTQSTRGWLTNYTGGFYLGSNYTGVDQFYGYIDDFRITNAARWTANFTPPTTEGLTTARAAFVPDNAAFPHTSTFVTGNVYDENGNAAVRRVMSFERSSGKLIGDTYSNADGSYSVQSPASPVFVVALDDDEGIPRNAVVEDRIIPA